MISAQNKEFDQKCTFGRDYVSFWGPVTFQGLAVKLPGIYFFCRPKKLSAKKKRRKQTKGRNWNPEPRCVEEFLLTIGPGGPVSGQKKRGGIFSKVDVVSTWNPNKAFVDPKEEAIKGFQAHKGPQVVSETCL